MVDVTTVRPLSDAPPPPLTPDEALRDRAGVRYQALATVSNRRTTRAWNDVRATCRSSLWKQCAAALREFATVNEDAARAVARIEMPAAAAAHRDAMVLAMGRATRTARTLAGSLERGRPTQVDVSSMKAISAAMTATAGHADLLRARLGLPAAP